MRWLAPILATALVAADVWAAEGDQSWTFAPVMGISRPSLNMLYDGVFRAPFKGRAQITTDLPEDVEGEITYPEQDFHFHNPLPPVFAGPEAGLEFRRTFGSQDDLFIGISSWEANSKAAINVVFPLQGAQGNEATYERRGTFSFTQYFVGWRHYFYHRNRKRNLYINLAIHEIFDIDYEEQNVFTFLSGPPKGFQRIVILRSQATGILVLQAGVGAELRMTDRFSVGFEGAYAVGVREAPLRGVERRFDFNEGDRLQEYPDPISQDRETNLLLFLAEDGTAQEEVRLDFGGWKALVKFNIDF